MSAWLGAERIHHEVCGSTNDEAIALARSGVRHGTIVLADAQRAGRGRSDHTWHSPPGENLYMSCVLRPEIEARDVPPITLAAGLGVVEAVNSYGVAASLKWPNDVLVAGKKLAGILTEMGSRANRTDYVVVGIGVNLNTLAFPSELADIATSVRMESGEVVDRAEFIGRLVERLQPWFDRFFDGGVPAIADDWVANANLGSQRVRAEIGGDTVVGVAAGLEPDGALLITDDLGVHHRVVAGDVELVRSGSTE
jgi:BirA family biotin operon repressor/biotin-[acetyl-CoA-carboxylase] ligase